MNEFSDLDSGNDVGKTSEVNEAEKNNDFGDGDGVNDFDNEVKEAQNDTSDLSISDAKEEHDSASEEANELSNTDNDELDDGVEEDLPENSAENQEQANELPPDDNSELDDGIEEDIPEDSTETQEDLSQDPAQNSDISSQETEDSIDTGIQDDVGSEEDTEETSETDTNNDRDTVLNENDGPDDDIEEDVSEDSTEAQDDQAQISEISDQDTDDSIDTGIQDDASSEEGAEGADETSENTEADDNLGDETGENDTEPLTDQNDAEGEGTDETGVNDDTGNNAGNETGEGEAEPVTDQNGTESEGTDETGENDGTEDNAGDETGGGDSESVTDQNDAEGEETDETGENAETDDASGDETGEGDTESVTSQGDSEGEGANETGENAETDDAVGDETGGNDTESVTGQNDAEGEGADEIGETTEAEDSTGDETGESDIESVTAQDGAEDDGTDETGENAETEDDAGNETGEGDTESVTPQDDTEGEGTNETGKLTDAGNPDETGNPNDTGANEDVGAQINAENTDETTNSNETDDKTDSGSESTNSDGVTDRNDTGVTSSDETGEDKPKRFEDYSTKELMDMINTNPEKLNALNMDFRERYEAEARGMSVDEYRDYKAHLRRIKLEEEKEKIAKEREEKLDSLVGDSSQSDSLDTHDVKDSIENRDDKLESKYQSAVEKFNKNYEVVDQKIENFSGRGWKAKDNLNAVKNNNVELIGNLKETRSELLERKHEIDTQFNKLYVSGKGEEVWDEAWALKNQSKDLDSKIEHMNMLINMTDMQNYDISNITGDPYKDATREISSEDADKGLEKIGNKLNNEKFENTTESFREAYDTHQYLEREVIPAYESDMYDLKDQYDCYDTIKERYLSENHMSEAEAISKNDSEYNRLCKAQEGIKGQIDNLGIKLDQARTYSNELTQNIPLSDVNLKAQIIDNKNGTYTIQKSWTKGDVSEKETAHGKNETRRNAVISKEELRVGKEDGGLYSRKVEHEFNGFSLRRDSTYDFRNTKIDHHSEMNLFKGKTSAEVKFGRGDEKEGFSVKVEGRVAEVKDKLSVENKNSGKGFRNEFSAGVGNFDASADYKVGKDGLPSFKAEVTGSAASAKDEGFAFNEKKEHKIYSANAAVFKTGLTEKVDVFNIKTNGLDVLKLDRLKADASVGFDDLKFGKVEHSDSSALTSGDNLDFKQKDSWQVGNNGAIFGKEVKTDSNGTTESVKSVFKDAYEDASKIGEVSTNGKNPIQDTYNDVGSVLKDAKTTREVLHGETGTEIGGNKGEKGSKVELNASAANVDAKQEVLISDSKNEVSDSSNRDVNTPDGRRLEDYSFDERQKMMNSDRLEYRHMVRESRERIIAGGGEISEDNKFNTSEVEGKEKGKYFENVSYNQGQNDIGAFGTCGPTSIANSLNRVTGTNNYSENGVLHSAWDRDLCHKSDNPYSCGGTTTRDVVNIIDNVKDPESNIHTEVYDYDNALSVDALADRLDETGTVAMVGVDSATLWDRRGDVSNSGLFQGGYESPSDHWITVDSPVRDENGNLTGFNIIDSGGGESFVDRDKFERMYQGDDNHRVSDPTAILVSNKGEAVNTYEQPEGVQRAANYKGSADIADGGSPPTDVNEIKSAFSKENFSLDGTYDSKCSKEFSDLKNKNVMELAKMGESEGSIKRTAKGDAYTPEEISRLKDARDSIEAPKSDTVMQKVACVDTGDIQSDLKDYLNPTVKDPITKADTGVPCDCKVYGFVSKAEDTAPFTNTPEQCYETLRLDYKNTPYCNPDQSVYVVRYKGDTGNYSIPYSKEFGGTRTDGQPFTGNGYTGSSEHVVPEYVSSGTTPSAGEIFRVNPDGTEEAVAYYDSKDKVFKLYDEEVA